MDLSVIIPTYNRSHSLAKTLECLQHQQVSAEIQWEVIVVNNNCTDDTKEVVTNLVGTFPVLLRHVIENNQGASNARNRGILEAYGKILAFTDDDVRPDPNWIQTAISTFERQGCDAVVGRIELEWTFTRPRWVTEDLLGFLARIDYGTREMNITTDATPPYGPNMVFKKQVFDRVGMFDPKLGRNKGSLATGEEPELFARALAAGFKAVYQPSSLVYHEIQPRQLKKSFFRKSHFFNGVNAGLRYNSTQCKRILGVPLFTVLQFWQSLGTFVGEARRAGFQKSLRKEVNVWYLLGFMVGCAQNRRGYRNVAS